MRDFCYLHGFVERERSDNNTERFVYFFADDVSPEAEKRAFAKAVRYMQKAQPSAIYYYSKYERTIYRKLWEKYPDVCTEDELVRCSSLPELSICTSTLSVRSPSGRLETTQSRP